MKNKTLLVLSSPSGGGKTVVAKHLISKYNQFVFSVSATTRSPRINEQEGIDYYYLSKDEFEKLLLEEKFIESEEIFGNYYGTLKSEIENKVNAGNYVIFDIDVKGAMSVKKAFPEESLLVFIAPPSLEVLESRLKSRKTESDEQVQKRLSRAEMEITLSKEFDYVVVNNILEDTFQEVTSIIENTFIL